MVFATPMTMNMYFYYSIFETVRNSGASDKKEKKQQNKELAIAKVGLTCILFFAIAWTPYAIVGLVGQFTGPENISPRWSTFPALFAKAGCIYNAYIYGFMHPKYKYGMFLTFQTSNLDVKCFGWFQVPNQEAIPLLRDPHRRLYYCQLIGRQLSTALKSMILSDNHELIQD